MISRKLDSNGDLVTSGDLFARDVDCVAQTIQTRLKLFMGECFRDNSEGMPWYNNGAGGNGILNKGFTLQQTETLIKRRINTTPGVIKMLSFSMDFNNTERSLAVFTQVLTQYGVLNVQWEK